MMRRNELQIQADLLGLACEGSGITRLVYQGNMNFRAIMPHLKRMLDAGLMDLADGIYYTTEKGLKFVEAFKELMLLQHL